ncbi:tetratricopeptide repeat protein [Niallia sp. FSL W8-0635]|uniref:tetratricopeptide repeat protein n=1 Tax=Niallia sp. FSL W8-0635 TaxID=2975337 RepID=UPI0009C6AC1C|nr:Capsular polysaccharide biosynthesis protein [Mycobacteroides abscessus subsp. abscessus]HEO8419254.1 tetratricopeptide repeat protein [Yersinia enterocolitica]
MDGNFDMLVENGWLFKNDENQLLHYFSDIVKKYPNSARAKFELGNVYDYLGQEMKAIPLYEEALEMSLKDEWEAYALIQLGSSLKNVGKLNDALEVLTEAETRFPHLLSISMFLGITLHHANRESEGMKTVLKELCVK